MSITFRTATWWVRRSPARTLPSRMTCRGWSAPRRSGPRCRRGRWCSHGHVRRSRAVHSSVCSASTALTRRVIAAPLDDSDNVGAAPQGCPSVCRRMLSFPVNPYFRGRGRPNRSGSITNISARAPHELPRQQRRACRRLPSAASACFSRPLAVETLCRALQREVDMPATPQRLRQLAEQTGVGDHGAFRRLQADFAPSTVDLVWAYRRGTHRARCARHLSRGCGGCAPTHGEWLKTFRL